MEAREIKLPNGIWGDVIRGADRENFKGMSTALVEALNEAEGHTAWKSARAEGRFIPRRLK